MLQFLFDTDHLTLFQHSHPSVMARLVLLPPVSVGISPISMEEALRGRLAQIARAKSGYLRIQAYAHFVATVQLLFQLPIVAFDFASEGHFQQLRSLGLRVGTQDLKIAAVAKANNLTLLTRNRADFSRIPGLIIANWSV